VEGHECMRVHDDKRPNLLSLFAVTSGRHNGAYLFPFSQI
jgi:hypothetical protein